MLHKFVAAVIGCCFCWSTCAVAAEGLLVEGGRAKSEIVISPQPSRTTRLAAYELQTYLEKISGAKLDIVTEPSGKVPVRIFVGRSSHTDRLGITSEDLKDGAYRIAAKDDWLVLIGDDAEFTPVEPWARNNDELVNGKLQREWSALAKGITGAPNALMHKDQFQLPGEIGLPSAAIPQGKVAPLRLWGYDERGSFNAVCGFLHRLGVRWYFPGELGEIVPGMTTIPLPQIDEVVRPDFALRRFSLRFGVHSRETVMWAMRLGLRDPYEIQTAHGMDTMTSREEVFAAHPDWFALYGGKRLFKLGDNNQLCYSNEELLQETVRYVQAQFYHLKYDMVSVMPPDGYAAMCQCPLCEGKETPDGDDRGRLSDYVWGFVNRVAKEVRKTHPDKRVLNCAYGVYTLPPRKIDKLEPNVVVSIVGGRRHLNDQPQQKKELKELREGWAAKTHHPIIVFENYPFTDRGWYLPAFMPHAIADSVNATKDVSQGEDIWLSFPLTSNPAALAFDHFQVYFTAKMYWGGPEHDVDAMFREYCRLFYGPAEKPMHEFFVYCEANWRSMEQDKSKADAALALFDAAKAKVEPNSAYGRRVAMIDAYLDTLRHKVVQLAQKRGPVPSLRLVGETRDSIVIDGKLDDDGWVNCPNASTGRLSELETGRQPIFGTALKSAWKGDNLYFAIRCDEHPGEPLNIASRKHEDQAVWYGDAVEIELETESHSYYQIVVNPAGALVDLDRGVEPQAWFSWDSQAEVATHVADDHWTVEIRIPVTQDENDPLHQVIGRKPSTSLPWHINICRQRIRDNGSEYSAFAPTGNDGFHSLLKFAHFFDGNHYEFDADPDVKDFLTDIQAAAELRRQRKPAESQAAYLVLADGKGTPLQKSAALEQAAAIAAEMREFDRATELAGKIPIAAVKKTVLMRTLLEQGKVAELLAQFGDEDIAAWPFWKAGDGWFARGRAYALTGVGEKAEADFSRALEFVSDGRTRKSLWLTIGGNRESNLKDDASALAAYLSVVESVKQIGGADEFAALQAAARILSRTNRHAEAVAALKRADIDRLQGYWRGAMLLSLGDTYQAAGRKQDARQTFQAVMDDTMSEPRHRTAAEERIKSLDGK